MYCYIKFKHWIEKRCLIQQIFELLWLFLLQCILLYFWMIRSLSSVFCIIYIYILCIVSCPQPNQKFIVVATLRMVGNLWLWSIMLGNANEARKSRVGYSRLPTEFLIPETQQQATMIIVGIPNVPNMFVKVVGIIAIFDDSQLLADYHCHFHAYLMILSVYATDYCLNFENKCTRTYTRTHAHTHARWRQFTIFQLNEIF